MTVLVGSLIEAWDELRIHKLRVLLSLIGVAVSVCAMTGVLAIGQMSMQVSKEMMETWNGRDTTVSVYVGTEGGEKERELAQAYKGFADRFDVDHWTRTAWSSGTFSSLAGKFHSDLSAVDPEYGLIKKARIVSGSWFSAGDKQRLAPAIVVNQSFMREVGVPEDLSVVPKITYRDAQAAKPRDLVVIGVMKDEWEDIGPQAWILFDSLSDILLAEGGAGLVPNTFEFWVDPSQAAQAREAALAYFKPFAQGEYGLDVFDNSGSSGDSEDFLNTFRLIVLGIGIVILGIGALSLVNISLVTVQQRIREIGIRRAFGATSGRVFFSIMMESVVATFFAGFIGVMVAIVAIDKFPVLEMISGQNVENPPPFPIDAALLGLVVSTIIGALAGLIPGIVATKIKPIEAMRSAG